jgi:tryptophan synthase alpha chain
VPSTAGAAASVAGAAQTDPLAAHFAGLRARGRCALITYVTAGFPTPTDTADVLAALADGGADLIELGVPFSDPVADGPTIQRASQRALEHGVGLRWTLDALRAFHATSAVPVVLFSYLNPIMSYGVDRFVADAVDAGAAGVLLTDLPAGADPLLERKLLDSPLAFVRLVAPTTPPERLAVIAAQAQGFIYYVGRMGVTGAQAELRRETLSEVVALRGAVPLPVAVGFGVSTPAQAAELARAADGVVVGSAIIDALERGGVPAAAELVAALRAAMD